MTADYGMIVQSLLASHLAPSGKASTAILPADASSAAFLQALLQQFQGALPAFPEGVAATGQGAESSIAGNAADAAGKGLPDADELMDQLEQQGLTPEQLAQLLVQLAAPPQADAMPVLAKAEPEDIAGAPATNRPACETTAAPASPVLAELAAVGASGLDCPASAPAKVAAEVEASRSTDGGVGPIPPLLSTAPDDAPEPPSEGAEFSNVLEKVDAEASSGLSGAHQAPPDGKSLSELPGVQRQPVAESAKEPAPAMDRPVGHPGWSQDLSERVLWMAGRGLQAAELRLDPAHLGPLEVRIDLNQDQASIRFVSHHAAVREAIESAIPKLREMLGAQQLNLMEVNVSQHSFTEQRHQGNAQSAFDQQPRPQGGGVTGPIAEGRSAYPEPEPALSRAGRGLLSLYA